jgi:hypothetical protein
MRKLLWTIPALLFLAIGAPNAHADSTYTYAGQPYSTTSPNFCNGTYLPVCTSIGVSGTITLANPLGDNLVNAPVTPLMFSFTGGTNAFDLTQASSLAIESFEFSTDASGNITEWALNLATLGSNCSQPFNFVCLGTFSNVNGAGDFSAYDFNHGTPSEVFGAGTNSVAGSWTVVPTPEPSTFSLMLTGLWSLVLTLVLRKRVVQSPPQAT